MLSRDAHIVFKIAKNADGRKAEYLSLKEQLNWDFDRVKSAGNQLIKKGLATEKYTSTMPGNSVLWGIVLTEEGRNSKKYFLGGIASFLFKSIAVPIIVAFFTALITAYVTTRIISG